MEELRKQIDAIDAELLELFVKRLSVSDRIAEYKKAHQLPIFVKERETAMLARYAEMAGEDREEIVKLFRAVLTVSKERQEKAWRS